MTAERLRELLGAIAGVRTLVVGDAMLDRYVWGTAERVSPEAPVLVVRAERETAVPGGAANVIHGLLALGARAGLVAVAGADAAGATLRDKLDELGAVPVELVTDPERMTTTKTRVVAHTQQVVRLDREAREPLSEAVAAAVRAAVRRAADGCRGLLLSDYDKGVLTAATIADLLAFASERGLTVAVNAKPANLAAYRGVDLLTVNRAEAQAACGVAPVDAESAGQAATLLGERTEARSVLVTLGPDGAVLRLDDGHWELVPAVPVQVFDPAGAGDTTIAAAHLALCAGASPREAVELAMRAAAVVVRKVGVAVAEPDEILAL